MIKSKEYYNYLKKQEKKKEEDYLISQMLNNGFCPNCGKEEIYDFRKSGINAMLNIINFLIIISFFISVFFGTNISTLILFILLFIVSFILIIIDIINKPKCKNCKMEFE